MLIEDEISPANSFEASLSGFLSTGISPGDSNINSIPDYVRVSLEHEGHTAVDRPPNLVSAHAGISFNRRPLGVPMWLPPTPDHLPSNLATTMIDPSWPPNLPPMETLLHLIDIFFSYVPHAHRILHRPTFMESLLNHPSSDQFP